MLISIIIATYNASKTLKTCLDSIVPQLCSGTELIIVDGGSKDNTNDIIKSYGDKVSVHISEPDKGIYDAWNKGVALSHGEWVMFIGADDILLPNAVETYLNVIKNTANIDSYDYICAHNEYVDFEGKLLKIMGNEPRWSNMRRGMAAAHVASLHNKKNRNINNFIIKGNRAFNHIIKDTCNNIIKFKFFLIIFCKDCICMC